MIGDKHWTERLTDAEVRRRLVQRGYEPEFAAQAARLRNSRDYYHQIVQDALGDE